MTFFTAGVETGGIALWTVESPGIGADHPMLGDDHLVQVPLLHERAELALRRLELRRAERRGERVDVVEPQLVGAVEHGLTEGVERVAGVVLQVAAQAGDLADEIGVEAEAALRELLAAHPLLALV